MTLALLVGAVVDPEDGTSGPSAVFVDNGTVTAIVPGHDAPEDATVLDHRDATLVPGLIDAHVHLNLRADGEMMANIAKPSDDELVETTLANARVALRGGITTVRDVGSKTDTGFAARRAGDAASLPHLLLAGPPITTTAGHGWFFGGVADGEAGVRDRVDLQIDAGADWIKVMATGGGTPGTIPWEPSYSEAELASIVGAAHARGVKVTMHCLSAEGMRRAVRAGADHIEHAGFATDGAGGSAFDAELADAMAEAGVVVTPTLSVRLYMRDHQIALGADAATVDAWQRRFDNGMSQFAKLAAAGVRYAAGTDAGWHRSPFDSLATEIACIAECGPGAAAAFRSATSATAEHFGMTGHGRVRAGAPADLVLIDGNPTRDITALGRVRGVLRAGKLVAR
ncbi:amidohydrolase family protein [Microbacterium sp. NPDC079995]|uniref:amidohydrolase family protein n=1 Tax=unclassified Microbacterium TaxID=2609290 RepID=UPI00344F2E67